MFHHEEDKPRITVKALDENFDEIEDKLPHKEKIFKQHGHLGRGLTHTTSEEKHANMQLAPTDALEIVKVDGAPHIEIVDNIATPEDIATRIIQQEERILGKNPAALTPPERKWIQKRNGGNS